MWLNDLIGFNPDTFCFTELINKIEDFEKNKKISYLVLSQHTLNDLIKLDSQENFIKQKDSYYIKERKYNEKGKEYWIMEPIYIFNNKYYIAICNEINSFEIHLI